MTRVMMHKQTADLYVVGYDLMCGFVFIGPRREPVHISEFIDLGEL